MTEWNITQRSQQLRQSGRNAQEQHSREALAERREVLRTVKVRKSKGYGEEIVFPAVLVSWELILESDRSKSALD